MAITKKNLVTRTQLTFFSERSGMGDTIEYPGLLHLVEGRRYTFDFRSTFPPRRGSYIVKEATYQSEQHADSDTLTANYVLSTSE